jgi:hypothetical protein
MNKLLLAISATFLLNSTMAQAAVETFNFTFSGEEFSNTAILNGFVTFDTDDFVYDGNKYSLPFSPNQFGYTPIDFGYTVSGSAFGNTSATYNQSTFIFFQSPIALDFTRELVGQSSGERGFGPSFVGPSFAYGGDFNFFDFQSFNAPSPVDSFTLNAENSYETMKLTSFAPASIAAPVPEADTSAMLLTGLGVIGFMARRRNKAKVA